MDAQGIAPLLKLTQGRKPSGKKSQRPFAGRRRGAPLVNGAKLRPKGWISWWWLCCYCNAAQNHFDDKTNDILNQIVQSDNHKQRHNIREIHINQAFNWVALRIGCAHRWLQTWSNLSPYSTPKITARTTAGIMATMVKPIDMKKEVKTENSCFFSSIAKYLI